MLATPSKEEELKEKLARATDLILDMKAGLEWYQDTYPKSSSNADAEMMDRINSFLTDINS